MSEETLRATVRRFAVAGSVLGAVVGGVIGLVVGLRVHAATAPFAVVEVGLPSAATAAVLGALVGLVRVAIVAERRSDLSAPR